MEGNYLAVLITLEFIERFLKTTGDDCVFYSIDGVPEDAKLVGLRFDYNTFTFHALFEHDSFGHVEEGEVIPVFKPKITTYYV